MSSNAHKRVERGITSSSVGSVVITFKSLMDASTTSMDHRPMAQMGELVPSFIGVQSKHATSCSNVLLAVSLSLPPAALKQCNFPPEDATRICVGLHLADRISEPSLVFHSSRNVPSHATKRTLSFVACTKTSPCMLAQHNVCA